MSKSSEKKKKSSAKVRSDAPVVEPAESREQSLTDDAPDVVEDDGAVSTELVEAPVIDLEPDEILDDEAGDSHSTASSALVPYSPLEAYLSEIRRFSPMSREEEHEVAVDFFKNKNQEAAYRLVSSNLWLVVKIARDYERVARNLLDLIQEGNIGLMEAVKNFDPYRGVRFPSYAVWWIKAYIIRFIIANWRLVKIGTTQAQRKLFFNLKKEIDRLEKEGIYPSTKLLAEKLHVREGDVVEMSQRLGGPDVSFDAPLQDDSDSTLLSVLPNHAESIEDEVAKKQLQDVLRSSISEFEAKLTEKERLIFRGRVIDDEKTTLQELSDQLSLSKERVRQIENKLREKLKAHIASFMGAELHDWLDVEGDEPHD